VITVKKGDISVETMFGILLFVLALIVLFYIFIQVRGESLELLDLIPI
jgi:uncharacterized protein (UPF0333 family)